MDRKREPLPTRVQDTSDLPAAFDDVLARGLAELGLDLSSDARAAIDGHVRLLLAWTSSINLTAIREPVAVAMAHVIDSLTAVPWLRRRAADRLLDLGSGGGFPGLPLAAALPQVTATLAEPIGKKAAFLTTAIRATGLDDRVTVATTRAEALAADRASHSGWPVVTARAVASTADLVELAFPLLAPGGALIAWKRGDLGAELEAARRAIAALGGGHMEILPVDVAGLAGHRLVIAERTGAVPHGYPRDPAVRKRNPW